MAVVSTAVHVPDWQNQQGRPPEPSTRWRLRQSWGKGKWRIHLQCCKGFRTSCSNTLWAWTGLKEWSNNHSTSPCHTQQWLDLFQRHSIPSSQGWTLDCWTDGHTRKPDCNSWSPERTCSRARTRETSRDCTNEKQTTLQSLVAWNRQNGRTESKEMLSMSGDWQERSTRRVREHTTSRPTMDLPCSRPTKHLLG